MKKILWKENFRTIFRSLPRFFSIFGLIALGTFALIGLRVTGPNMRTTAETKFQSHNLTDLNVVSNYGLDKSDEDALRSIDGISEIEFGYFSDVVIKGTTDSIRLFSKPKSISTYEVVEGRMPRGNDEIAIDANYNKSYAVGDEISMQTNDTTSSQLPNTTFKIVGFVNSVELIDKEQKGNTNVGTGDLTTFGVIDADAFHLDVFTIARMRFDDTKDLYPFQDRYTNNVDEHAKIIEEVLVQQGQSRVQKIQDEKLPPINEALQEVNATLTKLQAYPQLASKEQLQQAEKTQAQLMSAKNALETMNIVYTSSNRDDFPGYTQFVQNSNRTDLLSMIFPTFLFAIAALVSLTTMTRMVDEQRVNSGTLKALGYTNGEIKLKFIFYGCLASFLGSILGIVVGHTLLPEVIFNASAANFSIHTLHLFFYPIDTLIALGIALLCTVGASIAVINKELKQKPAQLLLPKPPKSGARIFLERITFLWKRLSFNYKVTARNIFRYKQRMFMTIFGVAGCTALLISGFGLKDSMNGILQRQYDDIVHYDMLVVEKDNVNSDQMQDIQTHIQNNKDIKQDFQVQTQSLTAHKKGSKDILDIQLLVSDDTKKFNDFISLFNVKNGAALSLPVDGVVVTDKLASQMGIKVGDTITVYDEDNQPYKAKVRAISEMYVGHYIFMNEQVYEQMMNHKYHTNGHMLMLEKNKDVNSVAYDLMKLSGIKGVSQSNQVINSINAILDGLTNVIAVLILCAIMLAMIVIFNLTNINVSERIRELSTIKVLGFYPEEVTMYIYRETIILSIVGIAVGIGIGAGLHQLMIQTLPPNNVMFYPNLLWTNIALSAGITLLITIVIMFVMHLKLKRVNMLDALKSAD